MLQTVIQTPDYLQNCAVAAWCREGTGGPRIVKFKPLSPESRADLRNWASSLVLMADRGSKVLRLLDERDHLEADRNLWRQRCNAMQSRVSELEAQEDPAS